MVERIGLEHLLFGAGLTVLDGVGGGMTDPSQPPEGAAVGVRRTRGRGGPVPVAVVAPPPDRTHDGRRPVIAILDTGIGPHPWLDVHNEDAGKDPADSFVTVSERAQDAIIAARAGVAPELPAITGWDEDVMSGRPLVGDVDSHVGHGTFIAGLVRQVAPKARVLVIRVMHRDGVAYEGDLLAALRWLVKRVEAAGGVDIVSLSLGYYHEGEVAGTPGDLANLIGRLIGHDVRVVAAAGNDATNREFLPAAFAGSRWPDLTSVGAGNPNGTKALFSNEAAWVRAWSPGAALVSTYPTNVSGSSEPSIRSGGRETLEPDDFSGGFAVWSGTSFAAPVAAAMLANDLIEAGRGDVRPLDDDAIAAPRRQAGERDR